MHLCIRLNPDKMLSLKLMFLKDDDFEVLA